MSASLWKYYAALLRGIEAEMSWGLAYISIAHLFEIQQRVNTRANSPLLLPRLAFLFDEKLSEEAVILSAGVTIASGMPTFWLRVQKVCSGGMLFPLVWPSQKLSPYSPGCLFPVSPGNTNAAKQRVQRGQGWEEADEFISLRLIFSWVQMNLARP